ncbi:hypothetical protein M9M90_01920 [Phenylobacterium sp. LH3H17]|uniref:hypothetical protein n=1 Tax=Phenylobacterium sp. LH3H17 TaxID=2903901 RepID=UPI0020C94256|nr:hypothetical protein [Phenylobacterium sp. LH3H17]UTP39954.1 hypothetical protein M9M90_01920 [Phenylobacterium sp. LH3H17]
MRTAIVSLIALAGVATSATAQTSPPAAEPAPVAAPPAAPANPPAVDPMAPPATNPAAPPAAVAPPAPVPEKVYTIPTTGAEGQIIDVLNRVCKPLVKGGNLDQIMKGMVGYKKSRRDLTYTATLVGKPYTLTIWPTGSNKDVCRMVVNYEIGKETPIIVGLNIFSFLHQPELLQQRNDYTPSAEYKRVTNTWEYLTDHESIGLVFMQLKKPDGASVNNKWDMGEVLYSERKF